MKRYEHLEETIGRELDKLDKKYSGNTDMTMQDAELARLLYSSMVKAETLCSMQEEREMNEDEMDGSGSMRRGYGRSYARGRDRMGRYVSRDMDGYSGHYPEWMPPYYR